MIHVDNLNKLMKLIKSNDLYTIVCTSVDKVAVLARNVNEARDWKSTDFNNFHQAQNKQNGGSVESWSQIGIRSHLLPLSNGRHRGNTLHEVEGFFSTEYPVYYTMYKVFEDVTLDKSSCSLRYNLHMCFQMKEFWHTWDTIVDESDGEKTSRSFPVEIMFKTVPSFKYLKK